MKSNAPISRRRTVRRVVADRMALFLVVEAQRAELSALLGSAIRLEIGRLPAAGSDATPSPCSEIIDLLRHLVLDARDAMPAGGALTILAGSVEVAGMNPARCAALFIREVNDEPRPRGSTRMRKGRGLGLGAATSIIEDAGGLLLFSRQGRETVTTIYFPPTPGLSGERGAKRGR